MTALYLLPQPRSLTPTRGECTLTGGRLIILEGPEPQAQLFGGRRLQAALHTYAGVWWELSATTAVPAEEIGAIVRVAPELDIHPQGYRLAIEEGRIVIEAASAAGAFYAVVTLVQIVKQSAPVLPCLRIDDWPDFAARGVMVDISRDKVPTMETLFALVDLFADWKINQLQLYTEHSFAYRNHREVWAEASPMTGEEILELDAFCRKRHIELVPNQNSFGHMERWLKHERYAGLAEAPNGFTDPWGNVHDYAFSLCPGNPGSIKLVRGLYQELLPHFSSRMFNVGCDETFDLGQGASAALCAEQGTGRVYLDFLQKIYREVSAHGRTMQFWGDIIIQHPELISELPKDVIALEWGYEADHPFAEQCPQYAASSIPFYVCPGTSSWCSLSGRTENALGNLRSAAEHGLRHGASGYLITDWGDLGHWQMLPISYLGFAVGAASAWAHAQNVALDVARTLDRLVFRDSAGVMGRLAYDLGNVYRLLPEVPNGSLLFWLLQLPLDTLQQLRRAESSSPRSAPYQSLTPEMLHGALEALADIIAPLAQARVDRPDAQLIKEEYSLTARLLRHACRRGLLLVGAHPAERARQLRDLDHDLREIIADYRRIWLARNRPGGLSDSAGRLEQARLDYQTALS